MEIFFKFCIFIAGFVDSIVGGGGLITLPVFTILVGPGAPAVGTNKIIATVAALTALLVYAKNGHLRFKLATSFFVSVAIGTFIGSKIALILPIEIFKYLVILICPIFLYIILNKKHFINEHPEPTHTSQHFYKLIISGLLCGMYDGSLGPGGGTLMLLSLVIWARLPLMIAIASSKFANVISATTALTSFSLSGKVNWPIGLNLAAYAFVGALIGSSLANRKAEKIARPLLVLVVIGLMIKLLFD
jgi:uncharacterized membrane protein YfcA